MSGAPEPILLLADLNAGYGSSQVLFGVNVRVGGGEAVGLVGRNGAGKTTMLRAIMGIADVESGLIRFDGQALSGMSVDERARAGIAYVAQERRIFSGLSVGENLEVGRRRSTNQNAWSVERVLGVFPSLRPLLGTDGGRLSGGEQQMLAIARALMGNPRLLLLDEPSEGLAPLVVRELAKQIVALKSDGLSILISEQNIRLMRVVSDRLYVLESGQIRLHGSAGDTSVIQGASQFIAL